MRLHGSSSSSKMCGGLVCHRCSGCCLAELQAQSAPDRRFPVALVVPDLREDIAQLCFH
jgi:hypothetical protein